MDVRMDMLTNHGRRVNIDGPLWAHTRLLETDLVCRKNAQETAIFVIVNQLLMKKTH